MATDGAMMPERVMAARHAGAAPAHHAAESTRPRFASSATRRLTSACSSASSDARSAVMFPPNSTRDNAASSLSSGCCHRSRYTFWHTSQASRSPHRATDGPRARRRARTGTRPPGRSQASRTAPAWAVLGPGCRTAGFAGCAVPCQQDDPATLWEPCVAAGKSLLFAQGGLPGGFWGQSPLPCKGI